MQHLKDDGENHKTHWLRSIMERGTYPQLKIMCIVENFEEAFRTEKALIKILRQRGENLTNATDGGEGGGFAFMSPERQLEIARMGGRKGGEAAQAKMTVEQRYERALLMNRAQSPEKRSIQLQNARASRQAKRQKDATLRKLVQLVITPMRMSAKMLYEQRCRNGTAGLAKTWTMPITEKQRVARRNNMRQNELKSRGTRKYGHSCPPDCDCARHHPKPFTAEHRANLSAATKGFIPWNKGV